MTIVAVLSRKLYETFGDEAAGAMVDWMHRKMDGRFADVHAKIDLRTSELNGRIDERIASARFDILKWSFVFWATTLIALLLRTR